MPVMITGSTVSSWPTTLAVTSTAVRQQSEAIWVAATGKGEEPQRLLTLEAGTPAGGRADPEHVVELVWAPDSAHLVAITRRAGPPVRSRILLLSVPPENDVDPRPEASELAVLPADVLTGSAVVDSYGKRVALITRSAAAATNNGALNLVVLELRPDGAIRDLADLGPANAQAPVPSAAW